MLELTSVVKFISVVSDVVFWLEIGVKLLERYYYFVLLIVSESPSIVDLSGFSPDNVEKCTALVFLRSFRRCKFQIKSHLLGPHPPLIC